VPYISVIILAYNRREYLLGAFKSAVNQTLPRNNYEIIVTKNFKDKRIDKYIKKYGGKLIFFEKGSYGEQLADALKYARGEVVCILEDDDEFTDKKLSVVEKIFRNTNTYYFHNAVEYIDENGNKLQNRPVPFQKEENIILNKQNLTMSNLIKFEDYYPTSYPSSMAIKRSILINNLAIIKKITVTPDLILYLLSLGYILKTNGFGYISKEKLTRYCFHESTSISIKNFDSFKVKKRDVALKVINDLKKIYPFINSKIVRQYTKYLINKISIDYYLWADAIVDSRIRIFVLYLNNFKHNFFVKPIRTLGYALLLILFLLAPEFTRSIMFRMYKN
jgi:glycosyltransferase involved in cell wall biosynthesis